VLVREASEQWECRSCGSSDPPTVELKNKEITLEKAFNLIVSSEQTGNLSHCLEQLDVLMRDSLLYLGPTHSLIYNILKEGSKLEASLMPLLARIHHTSVSAIKKERLTDLHRLASIDRGLACVKVTE
jgi:hypothetical protein